MKIQLFFGSLLLANCYVSLAATTTQAGHVATENINRQVRFAERVISVELARGLSHSVREAREKCGRVCPETGALELAIGLIGVSQSDVAADVLVNLLGLRLDGAGSEELGCQILIRGSAMSRRLQHMQAMHVVEHCQAIFLDLRKRELLDVSDVDVEQVCRSEAEISSTQNEFLKAVKSKLLCEQ